MEKSDISRLFQKTFDSFREAANPEQATKMATYMKNHFEFLGIPSSERKRLSREFMKALGKEEVDWPFIEQCWTQPEREFQYLATDVLAKQKKQLCPENLPRLKRLITAKSWWDSVDALDAVVGNLALRYPEVSETLLEWSLDDNVWLRRVAIDHQLGRREQTNTALLERILCNNLGQKEFFINKAIGWALRDYSKTDPDWVRNFIGRRGAQMTALSVKEASRYL